MKAYYIYPPFDVFGRADERTSASIELIARMVFDSLRRGGDHFQRAVVWADPGEKPGGPVHEDIAVPHVVDLSDADVLLDWLRKSIDPNDVGGGDVRSAATCRCVAFGYDGQAMLLLRHEDQPPTSPDPELAVVEKRPDFLETDWFDGWARVN